MQDLKKNGSSLCKKKIEENKPKKKRRGHLVHVVGEKNRGKKTGEKRRGTRSVHEAGEKTGANRKKKRWCAGVRAAEDWVLCPAQVWNKDNAANQPTTCPSPSPSQPTNHPRVHLHLPPT
jgi:hypothetical protein